MFLLAVGCSGRLEDVGGIWRPSLLPGEVGGSHSRIGTPTQPAHPGPRHTHTHTYKHINTHTHIIYQSWPEAEILSHLGINEKI